ncbi:hypothetical protein JTB14_006652 [Gonioctena quinquepunctata]|nr:hypothetical protein JTB14_006652 [Gonioctena quinquepunctata]
MTAESAVPGPSNPKKRELARNITQLLAILEKSDCDEFDDVESVVSMGWDSSDVGEVSADNIQQNVDWKTNPQVMKNVEQPNENAINDFLSKSTKEQSRIWF